MGIDAVGSKTVSEKPTSRRPVSVTIFLRDDPRRRTIRLDVAIRPLGLRQYRCFDRRRDAAR
jgi:hypothetical protein